MMDLGKNDCPSPECFDTVDPSLCAAWADVALPFQVLQIGQVLLPALPAEVSTMLGRRISLAVAEASVGSV